MHPLPAVLNALYTQIVLIGNLLILRLLQIIMSVND